MWFYPATMKWYEDTSYFIVESFDVTVSENNNKPRLGLMDGASTSYSGGSAFKFHQGREWFGPSYTKTL